jgi:hypothetical protein
MRSASWLGPDPLDHGPVRPPRWQGRSGPLAKGRILAGFAGSAADGLTLCDLL